jgi:hypothetical protein
MMIRTQIQLTQEQAKSLKKMSIREKKSVAELIRISVDRMINSDGVVSDDLMKQKALSVVGMLHGPSDFAGNHDGYLADAFSK